MYSSWSSSCTFLGPVWCDAMQCTKLHIYRERGRSWAPSQHPEPMLKADRCSSALEDGIFMVDEAHGNYRAQGENPWSRHLAASP